MSHRPSAPPLASDALSRGYEPDAPPARPLILTGVSLIVVLVSTHAAVQRLLPALHPASLSESEAPRTPARDDWGEAGREQLKQLRRREEANLHSSGWLDTAHMFGRIPIEQAMRHIADKPSAAEEEPR